ncbi:peptidoglycan-binding protein [Kitasatospora sp. NPDC101155]|uniref:peptidoglycan-binding protein n=1 Tax=Kitasatospora sp. NPDC101155 TaxID=3364097 RepID=UPI00382C3471
MSVQTDEPSGGQGEEPVERSDGRGEEPDELSGGQEEPVEPGRPRMARRRRALLVVAVVAAVVAGGGLGAASLIKSPAERAADTAPPPSTLMTARVTKQPLTQTTVVRGQVYPPTQYNVTPTAASADITQLYVSALPVKSGDQVANGRQLAEVSGQPLFVLEGPVPAYRDLKPGSSGPDVTELQAALERLGYGRGGDAQGTYGPGTAEAVTGYYRHLGYPAPTTGTTTQQAVDTARKTVEADRQAITDLKAQRAAAVSTPTGAPTPAGTAAGGASSGGVSSGGATSGGATSGGQAQGAPAGLGLDQQLVNARKKLSADEDALAKAEAVNGPMIPAGEVVFLPSLPATVTAVNSSVGAPLSGPLLSLTSGGLAVTGQLTPAQAAGIKPGMAVEVFSEVSGTTVKGTVAELGAQSTTPPAGRVIAIGGGAGGGSTTGAGTGAGAGGAAGTGAGAPNAPGGQPVAAYVPLQITPTDPLPAAFSGQNVRITVLKSSAPDPVLSVPVAAVFTDSAGQTAVTRVDQAGQRTAVPVTTGVNANGYVGVTPAGGARLAEGDQVVVGQ